MSENNEQKLTIQDDTVVSLDYKLNVDDELIDESQEGQPIQFIQGKGQIIPGLERQIAGMSIGESKEITVTPEEGYGEVDKNAFGKIPRSEFPPDIPLEKGVVLQLRNNDGQTFDAVIEDVDDETVNLNFNHPLAGKSLVFQVTVVDVRPATEEELAHGHVHHH